MKAIFVLVAVFVLLDGFSASGWNSVVHRIPKCQKIMKKHGLTGRFPGAVAHGIHSITLEDIRYYFNPNATENNNVPTLNYDLTDPHPVLPNAPLYGYDTSFDTIGMRHTDQVLRNMDRKDFYLTNYNVLEQIVHTFHMGEIWAKTKVFYDQIAMKRNWKKRAVCDCVTDVESNGIMKMLPFMSLKIRYPGITSGRSLRLPDGGVADWSGNLYQYFFFNNWSRDLSQFNFNDDINEILSKATNKLVDNDDGVTHLDSVEQWNKWKDGMKGMNEHDNFELAMFLYCALN